MSEVEIRPARASDAESISPYVYSSGPAAFDFVFATQRTTAVDFLVRSLAKQGGEFGFQDHFAMTDQNQVIGSGAIFPPDHPIRYTLHAITKIFRHYGLIDGLGVMRRGLAIERMIEPARGDLWIIGHIGIDAAMRRQGLGRRLMEHLIGVVRDRGGRRIGLDVAVTNPTAESLYQQLGFQVTNQRKSRLSNQFATVPDHRRMELVLPIVDQTDDPR